MKPPPATDGGLVVTISLTLTIKAPGGRITRLEIAPSTAEQQPSASAPARDRGSR